jgi:ESX secretion system ATPase EccB
MQSRRDQVQAYFFVVGRLVSGLMQGKPDVLEHPNKRFNGGTFLGLLLAGLLVACFGIFGLLFPGGNNSWRVPGAVVLEKDTGARYVFLDGQLRPALNLSSALLAAGDVGKLVTVSKSSLTGVPVGTPIGIPGAPDGLPLADRLNVSPWTVCAKTAEQHAVASAATVTLRLDGVAGTPAPPDHALLVSTPDGAVHLVWRGNRHTVADPTILEAMGYNSAPPVRVSPAWLNVIPAGRDLRPPSIADIGKPGALISGKPGLIGQLYELQNPATGSDEIFVLQAGGLMPVSRSVASMLLTNPALKGAYPDTSVRPIAVGPGDVAGVQLMGNDPISVDLPPTPPALVDLGASGEPCMRFDPGSDAGQPPALVILPDSVERDAVPPAGKHTVGMTADQVVIPVGGGALVRTVPTPGAQPGTGFLVTDLGVKYPLVDDTVASMLGYGHLTAVGVPVALLALLPSGPALGTGDALVSRPISPPGS